LVGLQNLWGKVGNITDHDKFSIGYRVSSIKDLKLIINHFDAYPLITQKFADYQLFKQAFDLISRKEHLTLEGLRKIVGVKASINLGLSDSLKVAFFDIKPIEKPLIVNQKIKDFN
jgi:hypothetical protein